MTMKIVTVLCGVAVALLAYSFTALPASAAGEEFMEITTVESVVPMGLGRSKMMITYANGSQEEVKLENLYSGIGINFSNIQANDNAVVQKLNSMTADGWHLEQVIAGVQSPTDEGKQGIYLTRYFFRRSK
jgi:hypothetical protein